MPASRFLGADSLLALAKCFEEAKNTFLDISREAHQTWMLGSKVAERTEGNEAGWVAMSRW